MTYSKYWIRKAGLDALYFSGASKLLRPAAAGVGVILMLHRVRPDRPESFQPNKYLEITPDFLEDTLGWLKHNSYKFVSIDEARSRLVDRRFDERFVVITLDDGYHDVKQWAQPVLQKFGAPYAVYVATDFADGIGNVWWHDLESIVAANDRLELDDGSIDCGSLREKYIAYAELEKLVLSQPCHISKRAFIDRLAARHNYDRAVSARALCMGWDDVREMAADPLATIGAHTISHPVLAKAPKSLLRTELDQSRRILEDKLQRDVLHLAYPYGSADAVGPREFEIAHEAGYQTAVTTQQGVLSQSDGARLLQLPRINVDGNYQMERYLEVMSSGVAPALWSGTRRLRELYSGLRPATGRSVASRAIGKATAIGAAVSDLACELVSLA